MEARGGLVHLVSASGFRVGGGGGGGVSVVRARGALHLAKISGSTG